MNSRKNQFLKRLLKATIKRFLLKRSVQLNVDKEVHYRKHLCKKKNDEEKKIGVKYFAGVHEQLTPGFC